MIAKEKSLIPIHNSINLLNKTFFLFIVFAFLLFIIHLFTKGEEISLPKPMKKKEKREEAPRFHYEKMGEGSLCIDAQLQSFPFPDLSQQLSLLSHFEDRYLLSLNKGEKGVAVRGGDTLYLTYDEDQLHLSEDESPLWIRLLPLEEGGTALQMGVAFRSESGELLLNESRQVIATERNAPFRREELSDGELLEALDSFKGARWWHPDQLFNEYAGKEYGIYKGLERLEIFGEYVLFAEEGKTFTWKEGKWVKGEEEGAPLARVKEVSPHKMEWEVLDRSRLEWTQISFSRERARPIHVRMEEVLTRLRQRTTSRVSCRIDNRAAILKVGDWLFKTERGWQTIKSPHEVDAIVKFKIMGELFIFDGLQEIDGKLFFCGTLFDEMRTDSHPVRLPISQVKTLEHSPHTKKGGSTKIQPSMSLVPSRRQEMLTEGDIFEE